MNLIWRWMKKRSPSGGQNGQLVHWWLLVHTGPNQGASHQLFSILASVTPLHKSQISHVPKKKNRVLPSTLSKAVSVLSHIHLKAIPRLRLRLLRTLHNNTLKATILSVSAKTQTNLTRIECSTNVGSVRPLLSSWMAVTNCRDLSLTSSDPGNGFR